MTGRDEHFIEMFIRTVNVHWNKLCVKARCFSEDVQLGRINFQKWGKSHQLVEGLHGFSALLGYGHGIL